MSGLSLVDIALATISKQLLNVSANFLAAISYTRRTPVRYLYQYANHAAWAAMSLVEIGLAAANHSVCHRDKLPRPIIDLSMNCRGVLNSTEPGYRKLNFGLSLILTPNFS
jgi:hypothetical protein